MLAWFVAMGLWFLTVVPAQAFEVTGLATPESFIVDSQTGHYYISNINGEPAGRDNNGFITKLDKSGKVTALRFVEGGKNGVTLHAPKGLAVVDNVLYVTDIDSVRGFDKETGKLLHTIDLKKKGALFLNDLTVDDQGVLYVSDTTVFVDPQAPPTLFKIDTKNRNKVSILVRDADLGPPNGLMIHPTTKRLLADTWGTGRIVEVDPDGKFRTLVADPTWKDLDGLDYDRDGNLYVSSFSRGTIYKVTPDLAIFVVEGGMTTPADVNVDRINGLLLIPSFDGNRAVTLPLAR